MPSGRFSRNTVLAGTFVLLFVGAFVAAIVLLNKGGVLAAGSSSYTIRFELDEGADGLEKGSPVKLGGVRVGSVTSVEFDPKPEEGAEITGIVVGIAVKKNLKLYKDAQVTLVRPLLGTNSALNIVKLVREKGSPPLGPGGRIKGELAAPGFVSQADYARFQDILNKAQSIAGSTEKWISHVDKDWPTPYDNIKTAVADAKASMADLKAMTSNAQTKWPEWQADIDAILKTIRERADSISKRADDGMKQAQDFLAAARKVVDDNTKYINDSIASVANVISRFEKQDYPDLIKRAEETLTYARNAARSADQTVTTEIPHLKEIVAQSTLAAQQLKLTLVEVRAAPWRLIYQPNKKELENELLYNSVRAYSDSLAQVRYAADALNAAAKSLAATPEGLRPSIDQSAIEALAVKLKDSLSKSAEHEKLFYDRWIRENPK